MSRHLIKYAIRGRDFKLATELVKSADLKPWNSKEILEALNEQAHPGGADLALAIALKTPTIDLKVIRMTAKAFSENDSLDPLRGLKQLWDQRVSHSELVTPALRLSYYSAFIHTYINKNQLIPAVILYTRACEELQSMKPALHLPTTKLLGLLTKFEDCDNIVKVLLIIQDEHDEQSLIVRKKWIQFISLAYKQCHYGLMKMVYDNYLVSGIKAEHLDTEEIVLSNTLNSIIKEKELSDLMVSKILQVIAGSGDIHRTLQLIEIFFIHQAMAGQKGLSKDLCLNIIEAYCSAQNEDAHFEEGYHDTSVERVLDILAQLNTRLTEYNVNYKDISEYMSQKFLRYIIYDPKIELSKIRKAKSKPDADASLPEKKENTNIHASASGNVLANLDILVYFTNHHLKYIDDKGFPSDTKTLLINCILNHISVYQNSSGIAYILKECRLNDYFDDDLISIILNSFANSSGSKLCSLHLFLYLKRNGKAITDDQYFSLISSCLRGDFHDQLYYFMYHYLQDHETPSTKVLHIINDLPEEILNGNANTRLLLENLHQKDSLPKPEVPVIRDQQLKNFKRHYIHHVDVKDHDIISKIF